MPELDRPAPLRALPPNPESAERVASVDALRGLVITLMVFVNDLAGAPHVPSWLKHASGTADAMTLPDIVFPAFLFIVGVSIPLAFERARAQGQSPWQLGGKVCGRTFALLVMGVVMVNLEEHNPWWRGAWGVLAYGAMFLAFAAVPSAPGRARTFWRAGRLVGGAALVALGLAYRTNDGRALLLGPLFDPTDTIWLRHSWWGILGLIGWAYLTTSLIYLVVGRRREWLVGATGCLMLLFLAAQSNVGTHWASRQWLAWAEPAITVLQTFLAWINSHVSIGTDLGSLAAITMAGCCLGSILSRGSEVRSPSERVRWALVLAVGLFAAGVLLDAPYGISKIRATPAWCFYCAALTASAWVLLFWLMDIRGWRSWSRVVRPAGANPLLAYVLHPSLYLLAALLGPGFSRVVFFYQRPEWPALVAILGSSVMALLVVQLTGWIVRTDYRLRV
jgi:heparan-alpha-glucosaminide N-acetyltransferase